MNTSNDATKLYDANDVAQLLAAREADRILLIPTQQRDLAATLGARTNEHGDWVVHAGANLDTFAPWISSHRASSFGVLVAKVWCGSCSQITRVVGLLLPNGFEDMRRQSDGTPVWARNRHAKFLPRYMSYIAGNALARLNAFNPNFRLVSDGHWGDVYMNHCEHCGEQRHENDVTGERSAAIEPEVIGSNAVDVVKFDEPVYVHAGDGLEFAA
jgi:hypothetical protein